MIACSRFDNYEQVKSILYKNKNINIKGKNGNTALTIAAMFSTFRVVKFLLLNNADPNEMNNNMETALFNSINRANNQIDEFEIIKLLIKNTKNINEYENINGITYLILATKRGHMNIVELLLNYGVHVNGINKYGETALMHSLNNNSIMKLLLDFGADIDKQDNIGNTALIHAAFKNNKKVIEFLLDYHATEFILNYENESFYDLLNDENKQYFLKEYPVSVYNAIYHNYKKSFIEFVIDFKLNIN